MEYKGSNDEKLLQFALQKLGMSKHDLENELTNELQNIQQIKEIVRLSDNFVNYCRSFNTACNGCQVKDFKNKYHDFGNMECCIVFKYLMEKNNYNEGGK